ncbi:MAG: hypothetical protein JWO63_2603 [Frankiales bacterium]|nr:hypothetical protein [Frankiales bacterium]
MPVRPCIRRWVRAALAIAAAFVLLAGLTSCTSRRAASSPTSEAPLGFRSQPSFLPTTNAPVDRVVTASPAQPQLAVQGVAVQVQLPTGHVLATVTGPHVPPFVAPPPETVAATFDVSLAESAGDIPIKLSDFTITDQLGRTLHPSLVEKATPPPSALTAGRTTTFSVTAVLPTGEGRIYWSPSPGRPIVGWDFIVEND